MIKQEFYSPKQFAEIIGTSSEYVREMVRNGKIKAINISSGKNEKRPRWRISKEEINNFNKNN